MKVVQEKNISGGSNPSLSGLKIVGLTMLTLVSDKTDYALLYKTGTYSLYYAMNPSHTITYLDNL